MCRTCGDVIVRFACDETGGGWMHDIPSDDPADGADHEAVPATGEEATPAGATATPAPARHESPHRRFYTLNSRKDGRS